MNGQHVKKKSEYALNVKVHISIERKKMQTKKCSKCGETKPLGEFNLDRRRNVHPRSYCKGCEKKYYLENKEIINKRHREYYKEHSTELMEYAKKYRKENREVVVQKQKEYRIRNIDKIKQQYQDNIEKERKDNREYSKKYPEIGRMRTAKRRAIKMNATTERIHFNKICEDHKWKCGICGKKIDKKLKYPSPKSVSLDHILPLSKGGGHKESNVQPAHLICNVSKYDNINNLQLKLI